MADFSFLALGGLDEIGKNMYVFDIEGKLFIVEAGLKYPDSQQLGVEIIIPDFKYLLENKKRIQAIFITHAHDDTMSALPHLLKQINIPIYTTPFILMLLKKKLADEGIADAQLHKISRIDNFTVGGVSISTFSLTHATPDAFGIAFATAEGYVVLCDEFIIDLDARMTSFDCDFGPIAEIGKKGVLCLMMEASNADHQGYTAPQHRIDSLIRPVFDEAKGRIIVSVYDQNFYRILEIIRVANAYKRHVFFYTDSFKDSLRMSEQLNYYRMPIGLETPRSKFKNDDDNMVIIVSGIGSELFRSMNKIATNEDETIELRSTDTVIIASPVAPETEHEATAMINELYKENVNVEQFEAKEVMSCHPSSDDLKMMLYLLKPKYFLPIMGEYRHFMTAANLALESHYTPDKIVILDNGQIARFKNGNLVSCAETFDAGETMIDGSEDLDVTGFVLKDRETLSTDGVIIVGISLNFNTKEIIGGPDIQSRGVIYVKDSEYIIKNISKIIQDVIMEKVKNGTYENNDARVEARERISRYVLKETGKRPMILPAIIEINVPADGGKVNG